MKSFYWVVLYGLSFISIDLNLFKRKAKTTSQSVTIEDLYEDHKQKRKKRIKKYKNKKFKKRKIYQQKYYKFLNSKPLDKRFSNQRSLRRMFRND